MLKFKKLHKKNGEYTDNFGLIIFAAQNLFKVNLEVVATSCNAAQPKTVYPYNGPEPPVATFILGYYQVWMYIARPESQLLN